MVLITQWFGFLLSHIYSKLRTLFSSHMFYQWTGKQNKLGESRAGTARTDQRDILHPRMSCQVYKMGEVTCKGSRSGFERRVCHWSVGGE